MGGEPATAMGVAGNTRYDGESAESQLQEHEQTMTNHGPKRTFAFSLDLPDERPIANDEFMESYVRYAAWLRVVSAREQLEFLKQPEVETMRRLAAVATFYQQVGMQLEDLACTLIAWTALARNRDQLLLADVLNRIVLSEEKRPTDGYFQDCIDALATGKGRVRVDASLFFEQLRHLGGRKCLELIGLPWSPTPSVKLAKGDELRVWSKLPTGIELTITMLSHSGAATIKSLFNKIKHGPQLVVTNLPEFLRKTGLTEDGVELIRDHMRRRRLRHETIRVLFDGARVANSAEHSKLPYIFLEDDVPPMEALLYGTLFTPTKAVYFLANFLRKRWYGGSWITPDAVIGDMEMSTKHQSWSDRFQ